MIMYYSIYNFFEINNNDFHLISEPSSTSLGPISINCNSAHSTTSPKTSPTHGLLTTAESSKSPHEDDISVTASPTPSPQASSTFSAVTPSSQTNQQQLFNNALAASLFLNTPLLPPPSQWFYSQFYQGGDWNWMNLRHPSLVSSILSPPEDHPDSSSEKVDILEVEDEDVKDKTESSDNEKESPKKVTVTEGINLSAGKVKRAAVTLIRQKEDLTANKDGSSKSNKNSGAKNSDVWRPY